MKNKSRNTSVTTGERKRISMIVVGVGPLTRQKTKVQAIDRSRSHVYLFDCWYWKWRLEIMPPGIWRATSLKECLYGMQNVRERFSPQGMSKERVSATLQNQASGFSHESLSLNLPSLTLFNHDEGYSPPLGGHVGLLHSFRPCFATRNTQLVTLHVPLTWSCVR
jgi:hypothetical protein